MATGDKTYYASQAQLNAKITEPEVEGTAGSVLTTDGEGGRVWSELTAVDSIVIDTQLSSTSTNPIQNKVVSSELGQLNQAKLDVPTGTPIVGKTIKIKSVNQDGTFVCEWADGGSGGGVTDVTAKGTSVVGTGGVAVIPMLPSINSAGKFYGIPTFKDGYCYGFWSFQNGDDICLAIKSAPSSGISTRKIQNLNGYGVIDSSNYDEAVKVALCDPIGSTTKNPAWTSAEQQAAQQRLGIVTLTQEEYDLIDIPSPTTIYIITEGGDDA